MKILYVNLASHDGALAVVENDRIAAYFPVDHRSSDAELLPFFENLLREAKLTPKDLTHLAGVSGPGGFTSLRVAAAFINTLRYALRLPVASIHLSDVYRARMSTPAFWLHSTKRELLFLRAPESDASTLVELTALGDQLRSDDAWMGELLPDHRTMVESFGVHEAPLLPLQDILPTFLTAQMFHDQQMLPWYGRGY